MRFKLLKLAKKFLLKLSFILLKISSVVLILLITIQIIINNPDFVNSMVYQYVGPQFEEQTDLLTEDSQALTQAVSLNSKYLTLKLKNSDYINDIRVKINDDIVSNFAQETINLELNAGDELIIDARDIKEGIWIEILAKPSFIDYNGRFIWLKEQKKIIAGNKDLEEI